MGMLGNLLKAGVAAKAVQMIQREARKPENRQKINDALASLKKRRPGAKPSG
jgi:hypothetical protein